MRVKTTLQVIRETLLRSYFQSLDCLSEGIVSTMIFSRSIIKHIHLRSCYFCCASKQYFTWLLRRKSSLKNSCLLGLGSSLIVNSRQARLERKALEGWNDLIKIKISWGLKSAPVIPSRRSLPSWPKTPLLLVLLAEILSSEEDTNVKPVLLPAYLQWWLGGS